uniref:Testis expressed 36 n=1 Tax=Macrostomum lignano TaxID=282301 RepID=A0A1I8IEQ1_9PLAT
SIVFSLPSGKASNFNNISENRYSKFTEPFPVYRINKKRNPTEIPVHLCLHALLQRTRESSSSIRSCSTFCTAVELDQGFEPRTADSRAKLWRDFFSREAYYWRFPFSATSSPHRASAADATVYAEAKRSHRLPNLDWSAGYSSPRPVLSPRGEPLVFLVQAQPDQLRQPDAFSGRRPTLEKFGVYDSSENSTQRLANQWPVPVR